MIVCICNNVNTDTINTAIEAGARSVNCIKQETGASACCGKCQFKVNRLLNEFEEQELMPSASKVQSIEA
ncbi:MAG TPA: NAD(P)H-nitrite reductase [Methylophaga aminisulfidivorans]|uniref:Bacterioferritin-associated ferredoxin n=2 Tax=root TaxID=1 RepID=A0A7C1W2U7_9GAMM|nr:NAD(P)H-nitrite reductase [Methylophaga aminisulfidivorans]